MIKNVLNIMEKNQFLLKSNLLTLIHAKLPNWDNWAKVHDPNSISLVRISGAMTNSIFIIIGPCNTTTTTHHHPIINSHPTKLPTSIDYVPRRLLLRVYGVGMHNYIQRDREIIWLSMLSEYGYGAKLLATFENGRFEEYLDSSTLAKDQIRDKNISEQIARKLCDLHCLSNKLSLNKTESTCKTQLPEIWSTIEKYLIMAINGVSRIVTMYPNRCTKVNSLNLNGIHHLILQLRGHLDRLQFPIVFAHNDLQYGNILLHSLTNEIIFVDYEYSTFNYRGFDIANHFCEWTADYHCPTPHKLDFTRFPSQDERFRFYRAYIDRQINSNNVDGICTQEQMELETMTCTLLSHLFWGLWGLVREADQLGCREIEFDYFEYGVQRMDAFQQQFLLILELANESI